MGKRERKEYAGNRYKNISGKKKQKRKENLRNYYKARKNYKLNDWLGSIWIYSFFVIIYKSLIILIFQE